MAKLVSAVKDGAVLILTYSDGRVFRRSIIYRDAVVSVPPDGSTEVNNVYVNSDGDLVVNHNGSELLLGPATDLTAHAADEDAHHTKYTDAEAKAAAVQAGAITDGVTKAPTHDAVYDVKVTAEAAQTAAEVDADIAAHAADEDSHHARYTDAEAVAAMGAKDDSNPLHHDRPDMSAYVANALFNANTILIATSDDTPTALSIAASRIVGRKSTGGIVALTGAELMAILSGQAGADFSMNSHKITSVTDPTSDQDVATKKYVDDSAPSYTRGRAFLNAEESNFPHGKDAVVGLNDVSAPGFDPESLLQTGIWQQGVADSGTNSTTIVDNIPTTGSGFVAAMKFYRVTWDGGASYGFITSVDSSTQISIYKTHGSDIAPGDTYTITKAHFQIATAGYYLVFGMVYWDWQDAVADKEYTASLHVNGVSVLQAGITLAAALKTCAPQFQDIQHFDAGDLVSLGCKSYSNTDTCDVIGSAAGIHTYLVINLLEAD